MARYNSSLASNSINGATTISSPYSGAFTNLTGSAPYTVTLPSPVLYPGSNQTFYNATAGTITLSTPSGTFSGTGGPGANTLSIYTGNVISVTSDGTNYIVISEDGSALIATSGTFSGVLTVQPSGGVSIAPSSAGSIDNVVIGGSAKAAGGFTALTATGQVNFTANTASTTTGTGSVVITGGLGVSGNINAASVSASLTGTIQTAAQPNITSTGSLSVPSLTVNGTVTRQILTAVTSSSLMNANTTNNMLTLNAPYSTSPESNTNGGSTTNAKWGIHFVGKTETNDLDTLSKSASIYAISEDTFGYNRRVGLAFFTSAFDANQTERLRIDNNGSIGVGTSAPVATLDVRGGLAVSGWSNNNGGSSGGLEAGWDGSQVVLQSYNRAGSAYTPVLITGSTIKVAANGGIVTTTTSTGLGIGTTPSFPLHIATSGGGDGVPGIKMTQATASGTFNWATSFMNSGMNTAGKNNLMLLGYDQSANNSGYIGFNYQGAGSSNNFMSIGLFAADNLVNIRASGNVGIGTTSPSYKLQVNGTTYFDTSTHSVGTEFQHVSRSFTAPGSGPREIFRVPSSWLCTNGIFSLSATRNSFVHGSMWAWTTTHNGAGQGTLTMLSSGTYSNVTAYLDVTSDGAATISVDWGAEEGYQVTILKMAGGAIDFSSNGSDWSTVQASRTRYSRATLNSGFRANTGIFDGSLSKGSGTFRIDHPLPELEETHNLVHSFIEGPQADLIYRGRVDLVNGSAEVNIDQSAGMTEGTFEALCRDVQCFTTNESDWTAVRGSVNGNILTIEAESNTATSSVSWMVIGERKDKHMIDTSWTDSNGKPILEPLKAQPGENSTPYPEEVPIFQQPVPDEDPSDLEG